ncbi:hypothetical protein [Streptomyces rhizosphaerihabitans]|nr:hypothetical protein [Streptomyces rhizosphaerihabitans]MCT9003581.1 hypothetical protein [Streptomyces rhizosphaerihabitans]
MLQLVSYWSRVLGALRGEVVSILGIPGRMDGSAGFNYAPRVLGKDVRAG